jgi:uncharacterized protein (DUF1501 family)
MPAPDNALARVESDVTNTERRIAEQKRRIAMLRADGYDTTASENVLFHLASELEHWSARRAEMLRALGRKPRQSD